MSQLDDILESRAFYQESAYNRETLKVEIKDLMVELIGTTSKVDGSDPYNTGYQRGLNDAISAATKKVNEL